MTWRNVGALNIGGNQTNYGPNIGQHSGHPTGRQPEDRTSRAGRDTAATDVGVLTVLVEEMQAVVISDRADIAKGHQHHELASVHAATVLDKLVPFLELGDAATP